MSELIYRWLDAILPNADTISTPALAAIYLVGIGAWVGLLLIAGAALRRDLAKRKRTAAAYEARLAMVERARMQLASTIPGVISRAHQGRS